MMIGVASDEVIDSRRVSEERDQITVASLLRTFRLAAGMSQAELAESAEMSTGAIGALEQGLRRAPYRSSLERIADSLHLNDRDRAHLYQAADSKRSRKRQPAVETAYVSNAPARLTSFVPRAETADIVRLSAEHRLVTVTGFAGVGKTRTVLEAVADHRASDVVFIDLSPITEDDGVALEIASAFRISVSDIASASHDLVAVLQARRALVILDNCEHVIAGVARVVLDVLRTCPDIAIIATSREPLGLSSEIVYRLPFLSVPPKGAKLNVGSEYSALELFVTRAQATDARLTFSAEDLDAAADICRRLDGIPLAIELAAGRASSLGVKDLRDRLNDLSCERTAIDLPTRHQTMSAAISWSFGLLTSSERVLVRRLSTLAGNFSLRCAETVCADGLLPAETIPDLVVHLVQKSLVESKPATTGYRYSMLASVRSYASSGLASAGESEENEDRLARYLLDLVREAENGDISFVVQPDMDNVRAAVEAKLNRGSEEDVAVAASLVGTFRRLWMVTGRLPELRRLSERIIERLDERKHIQVAALVSSARAASTLKSEQGSSLKEAIRLNILAGGFASAAAHVGQLAVFYIQQGMTADAVKAADEASSLLDRVPQSHRAQYFVRTSLAFVLSEAGDLAKARKYIDEVDSYLNRQAVHGVRPTDLAARSSALADIEFASGDYVRARDVSLAAIVTTLGEGDVIAYNANLQLSAAASHLKLEEYDAAEHQCRVIIDNWDIIADHGTDYLISSLAQNVATIIAARGGFERAAQLLGFSDAMVAYFERSLDHQQSTINRDLRQRLVANTDPPRLLELESEGSRLSAADALDMIDCLLD